MSKVERERAAEEGGGAVGGAAGAKRAGGKEVVPIARAAEGVTGVSQRAGRRRERERESERGCFSTTSCSRRRRRHPGKLYSRFRPLARRCRKRITPVKVQNSRLNSRALSPLFLFLLPPLARARLILRRARPRFL